MIKLKERGWQVHRLRSRDEVKKKKSGMLIG